MHVWVMFAIVLGVSETRHYYPYPYTTDYPLTTVQPSYLHKSVNDVSVVDEKTGIKYNPYSKHHPGRHVCTNQRNVTYPTRTKRVFCKPTYKKYMVRCGTQWCEGVRLVYEKYHKEVVANSNHTVIDYTCCPGWTQVTWRSHACNKPVCQQACMHGGRCVRPNVCSCPPGYSGTYCETKTSLYAPPGQCSPPCLNGGTCSPQTSACLCSSGYAGHSCERDVDECKKYKPCDQICYNTPGSYKCECKENFALQADGQTCRKESDDESGIEASDLEQEKLDRMERRLENLEKIVKETSKCEVTKEDLDRINAKIDKLEKGVGRKEVTKEDIQKVYSHIERILGDGSKREVTKGDIDKIYGYIDAVMKGTARSEVTRKDLDKIYAEIEKMRKGMGKTERVVKSEVTKNDISKIYSEIEKVKKVVEKSELISKPEVTRKDIDRIYAEVDKLSRGLGNKGTANKEFEDIYAKIEKLAIQMEKSEVSKKDIMKIWSAVNSLRKNIGKISARMNCLEKPEANASSSAVRVCANPECECVLKKKATSRRYLRSVGCGRSACTADPKVNSKSSTSIVASRRKSLSFDHTARIVDQKGNTRSFEYSTDDKRNTKQCNPCFGDQRGGSKNFDYNNADDPSDGKSISLSQTIRLYT